MTMFRAPLFVLKTVLHSVYAFELDVLDEYDMKVGIQCRMIS
jgi:hypothetical protein